jgi:hypothetical protein
VGIRPALLTASVILGAVCVAGALSPGIRGLRNTPLDAGQEEQWTTVSASV